MHDLSESYKKELKKIGDPLYLSSDIGYPTGFLAIDFRNGRQATGLKPNGELYNYNILGIADGSTNIIIGRSGCGKSTLATQIAGNIIRPFIDKGGLILEDLVEVGMLTERKIELLKFDMDTFDSCYRGRNEGITAENFFTRLKTIANLKISNPDKFQYDTGHFDRMGNPIIKYVPTVYILDSLAYLLPENFASEDDLTGGYAATSAAKTNTGIFKRVIPVCKKANIILILINHILEDISATPKKASLPYLKPGETLPGGRTANYSASNMFRINDGGKLVEGESKGEGNYDIDGNVADFEIVKTRTNKSGKSVPLLFNQEIGFDYEMSLLTLFKKNKVLNGGGRSFYIGDRKEVTFSQKDFKNKFRTDPVLQRIAIEEALTILRPYIKENESLEIASPPVSDTMSLLSLIG
jgi:ABC-type oligopeptide transport system ATPase subunit